MNHSLSKINQLKIKMIKMKVVKLKIKPSPKKMMKIKQIDHRWT